MQRVHTPEPLFLGFGRAVREIVQYRELLGQLVRKELKIKYKDSVLGFFWTLLRPLTQLLVYSLAIGFFLIPVRWVALMLLWTAVVVTLVSGLDYAMRSRTLSRAG